MNRQLLICFLLTSFLFLKAQDTIVKRDGEKIIAKVSEVNPDNVRYKRTDNPDGPTYTVEKQQLNYIIYSNGVKDMFDKYQPPATKENVVTDLTIQSAGKYYYYKTFRITEPDMHAVVKKLRDPKLNAMIKSVENKKFIQDLTFIVSIPAFFTGLYVYQKNRPTRGRRGGGPQTYSSAQQRAQKNGIVLMLGALACDVVSVSFMLDRRRHNHLVVNAYNNRILGDGH